ncbi:MAG: putative pre6S rRNA nuclease [Patescibacteria group bacterium]|jgi:putative Holliday junction resolvase|nr:putative pre6S rRNA nuclease [Patescibacteria group bacterium]
MPAIRACLALDIGEVRIGVAANPAGLSIAQPRGYIANDDKVRKVIQSYIDKEKAEVLVVGLPRGMQGQETDQTKYVRNFIQELQTFVTIPIVLQDEALTSVKAEQELDARGKTYERGDIDALAASYILDDYLVSAPEVGTNG